MHVRLFCPYENKWSMEVSDTGFGIPEDELPHIFDTFRQVESGAARVHGGFGLGLSIVKQLVNLMGGEIHVNSKVDVGTTVYGYSAAGRPSAESRKMEKPMSQLALIIEDDEDLASIFAEAQCAV